MSTRARRGVTSAVLVGACTVLGAGLLLAAVAVPLVGATDPSLPVTAGPSAPAVSWSTQVIPCLKDVTLPDGSRCEPAADASSWPPGTPLPVTMTGASQWQLLGDGDLTERLLGTAPQWAALAAVGLAVLLLLPVVRTWSQARPFAPGNAARLAAAAGVLGLGWLLATALPPVAAAHRLGHVRSWSTGPSDPGLPLPAGWLVPALHPSWWPLAFVALVLVLALATRRGARLAADTEGLV